MAQAKVEEATIEYKNALSADPSSPEAHYEFGMALLRQGDSRAGYRELGRAVDLKPDFIKARYQVALMHAVSKDTERAKEELEKIRPASSNAKETHYLAAQIAMAEKQPDSALKELKGGAKQGAQSGIDLHGYGQGSYGEEGFCRCREAFRKALEVDPKFFRARIALAQLYATTGKQDQAEQELLLATKADPENEELLHILGNFYSSTRRYDDLEKLYQDLLKKKPDSLIAKKRLVEIYFTKNDRKQAKQYIDEILKSNAKDNDGLYFRGRFNLADNDIKKAAEDLSIVTRNAPQFALGWFFLGQAQLRQNEINEAKKSMAKAAELAPNWIEPKIAMAQLYFTTGDNTLASDEIETILKGQPNNEAALLIKGGIAMRNGESDRALSAFQQAQKVNPQNPASRILI